MKSTSTTLTEVKTALQGAEIKQRLSNILGQRAPQFAASIINAVAGSTKLQECDPNSIMAASLIAASLDLPIDPNLGRAYIVPYKGKAQFQMGYKGFVELAIRTGKYKDMNVEAVYEDEIREYNPILGKLEFVDDFRECKQRLNGETDKIVGYYAWYELLAGFSKALYMTKEQSEDHAKKYSKTYNNGPWQSNFDSMAKKTVLKLLLSRWGILSIQMQEAITNDQKVYDGNGNDEYEDNPLTEEEAQAPVDVFSEKVIDVPPEQVQPSPQTQTQTTAPTTPEQAMFDEYEAYEAAMARA